MHLDWRSIDEHTEVKSLKSTSKDVKEKKKKQILKHKNKVYKNCLNTSLQSGTRKFVTGGELGELCSGHRGSDSSHLRLLPLTSLARRGL